MLFGAANIDLGALGIPDVTGYREHLYQVTAGKIVFRGTPAELTARGEGHGIGDAPLERGYSAVLAAARS